MQCTHDIQLPISSPSGDKVAALDYVECGATVGKVSWVLIAPSDVKLTSEKANLLYLKDVQRVCFGKVKTILLLQANCLNF